MKNAYTINIIFIILISILLLAFSIKGSILGPTYYQDTQSRVVGGPFESSNSTARYALTEAIVDSGTFILNKQQAGFAAPDVVKSNGNFLSIFTPGISFIGVPFFMLGKLIVLQQIFTYFSVTLFGVIDMLLIAFLSTRLGANRYAGLLSGFLFLFGTNAFSYSLFYTQHITSVAFLLLSFLVAMGETRIWKNMLFGVFLGVSVLLDIPNGILLLPVGIWLFLKHVTVVKQSEKVRISFNAAIIAVLIGMIPFIMAFAWYNLHTTGSPTRLAQTVGRAADTIVKHAASPSQPQKDTSLFAFAAPFTPRAQIVGLYTLLISNERSWLFYSPIVLLGCLGFARLYRTRKFIGIANVLFATVCIDILLYSMFADPWGGWAFGPRYLIPAAAVMCTVLAVTIQKYMRNLWFNVIFILVSIYSLSVNTIGALTTGAIPPKIEAIHLLSPIPYTYQYNIQLAEKNQLSPFIYNYFFSDKSGVLYISAIIVVLCIVTAILYHLATLAEKRERYE